MQLNFRHLTIGFFAGALAVLFFHQLIIFFYAYNGIIQAKPWNNTPMGPWGVPMIINLMFWGGVWGIIFAAFSGCFPSAWPIWLKGLVFGLLGPMLVGWFVMPLFKGTPFMAGGVPMRMFISATINVFFGIGTAWMMCFISCRLKA